MKINKKKTGFFNVSLKRRATMIDFVEDTENWPLTFKLVYTLKKHH